MAASSSKGGAHPVDQFRAELIQRIAMVHPVLDRLLDRNLLTQEQCDTVTHKETDQEKMRALYKLARGWGHPDKDQLYTALKECNPGVVENLEAPANMAAPVARKRQFQREESDVEGHARRLHRLDQGQWHKATSNSKEELRKRYMEAIKSFQRVKRHNSRTGEAVNLQKGYTPVLMMIGYPDKNQKEREIQSTGREIVLEDKGDMQTPEERPSVTYSPVTLQALFDPDKDGVRPEVVVLHGPAGIGKTWTSQKIIVDWASGNLYQDKFDYVFYLSCRELNAMTVKISLVQHLSSILNLHLGDLVLILKDSGNHSRLLFVIDGFDEFKWTPEEAGEVCHDISEETHKETLLRSLLKKELLEQSSLIITTRSLAREKLNTFIADFRYIEVQGFSDKDITKYFHDSFIKRNDAEKALSVIKGNNILLTMCKLPIMCWIVCTVLQQEIKKGLDLLQYKTTTSIYLVYLEGLLMYHGRKQPVHACLKKLCALANEGVLNQKILFEKEDLERHGLSASEVESVFLNENIFNVSIINQTFYSFIHLSVQEFLAAVYYVLDDGDQEGASGVRGEAPLPEICNEDSLPELCRQRPHLSLAVRFLFGLLYEKRLNEFSESTKCKISLRVKSAVEEWITGDSARSALEEWITVDMARSLEKEWITRDEATFELGEPITGRSLSCSPIDVISCLYETQDEDLIRRALPRSTCLLLGGIWGHAKRNKNDKKQLCYCLKLCECPLALSIDEDEIRSEDHKMLSLLLHKCQHLVFTRCEFQKRTKPSEPSKGWLAKTIKYFLPDEEYADLSWLINPESKIQELTFQWCHLSRLCCDDLHSVLVTNPCLTQLFFYKNPLEDSGVKRLCEGLRDRRCHLQELSLRMCNLSPVCCDDIYSVLVTSRSLTRLILSENGLKDSGMKHLCEGLRDPNCTLQELRLVMCKLTRLCCDDLRLVLVTNRTLTKLDLTGNNLEDSGIKRLCEGLRDPRCILQELRFRRCSLSSYEDLCSVITTNRTLTYLETSLRNYNLRMPQEEVNDWCEKLRCLGCSVEDISGNFEVRYVRGRGGQ